MKVSVSKTTRNGNRRFVVSWRPPGARRVKHYFKTRAEADVEAESVRLQQSQVGEVWLSLSSAERNEIIALHFEAQKRGVNLRAALEAFNPAVKLNKRVQAAFDEFMAERRAALVSRRTLAALKSNVGRFVATCSGRNLSEVKREDVLKWLGELHPRTFNTYLTSLNTFFRWCVKMKYATGSPAGSIEKIHERRMTDVDADPAILTVDQCQALLTACRDTDAGLIPYVTVCLFAGLRPEREAGKLAWGDVTDEILVRGLTSKTRQRRHVPIHPALKSWLARPFPAQIGPVSPEAPLFERSGPAAGALPPRNLRRRFEAVRRVAGLLEGWRQDCMRHTFASMSLATFGVEKTVAALGHGDYDMLFGHYRALVKAEDAAKFWAIIAAMP